MRAAQTFIVPKILIPRAMTGALSIGQSAIKNEGGRVADPSVQPCGQVCHTHPVQRLRRGRDTFGQEGGRVCGQPRLDQHLDQCGECALPHEDHGRGLRIGQSRKVEVFGQCAPHIMAGDELHPPRRQATGERNARRRRRRAGGRHAGDDLKRYARRLKRAGFFLQPPERAAVTGLQTYNTLPGLRIIHQQPAHMVLLGRRTTGPFAHADQIRSGARVAQDRPC
mmetsp:Transcript_29010/g.55703  ORF Transcript_29010/g.55703 Transcript_29010/m.55703 type:complete len:224 (+) Transcript_29010:492-1163(+)